MATITVNTAIDELDGSIFDGDVSLRDALAVASAGDVIVFSASAFSLNDDPLINTDINLLGALGSLNVNVDVTINGDVNGDGIADVTIDGNGGIGGIPIFEVNQGFVDLEIHGLHLTNGGGSVSSPT